MQNQPIHEDIAAALREALQNRKPIEPIYSASDQTALTIKDAYRIQSLNIEQDVREGAKIVGHKIGLTSKAMQDMMGVDTPDFGHLLDTMHLDASEEISLAKFIKPRVEPEIAFKLGKDLPMAGCTVADVLEASESMAACLELIDSRIVDWQIGLIDTVADNASSAAMILGPWLQIANNYADLPCELTINGEIEQLGSTSAVLGDPAVAVAWLANALGEMGVQLQAGHIVLSGSCTRAVDVVAGDTVVANFEGFDSLTVRFV